MSKNMKDIKKTKKKKKTVVLRLKPWSMEEKHFLEKHNVKPKFQLQAKSNRTIAFVITHLVTKKFVDSAAGSSVLFKDKAEVRLVPPGNDGTHITWNKDCLNTLEAVHTELKNPES